MRSLASEKIGVRITQTVCILGLTAAFGRIAHDVLRAQVHDRFR